MKNSKERSGGKKKRTLLIVLNVVLAVVLIVLILGTMYIESRLGLINKKDPETEQTLSGEELENLENQTDPVNPDFTGPTLSGDDIVWGDGTVEPIEITDEIINILLIGQDRREGETRARSDTMILCTVNRNTKTITFTSFMRDMYVPIPGYKDNRINVSYFLGGPQLLDTTLEQNFGVTVDGNVELDFEGFVTVIDLVGGVDIDLSAAEAAYLNNPGNFETDLVEQWALTEGVNHLNGQQALAYARIRSVGGDGDFGRTSRQRLMLNALVEKAKTLSLLELDNLLTQVLPLLTTDLSNGEILGYAMVLLPMLGDLEVNTQRIPADGTWYFANVDGNEVIIPSLSKNREVLAQIIMGLEDAQ